MTNQEALNVLINAKYCRNAEHEKKVNEAIMTLQGLLDIIRIKERLEHEIESINE